MRAALLLLSLCLFSTTPVMAQSGEQTRVEAFRKALRPAGDESGSERFLSLMESAVDTSIDARGFRASAELVAVGYRSNPLSKYRRFRKWSRILDDLVQEWPANSDIRFLRLTVKDQTPGFLSYADGIEGDCAAVSAALSDGYWSSDPEHEAFVTRILADIDACQ